MKQFMRILTVVMLVASFSILAGSGFSRPSTSGKGSGHSGNVQAFKRQKNTLSNLDFYFTNRGVLFNNDASAGLNWPRGTANSYIFGGGLWFATKKNIAGKRRKLVELGYNPNSGGGWYTEGEIGDEDNKTNLDSKYISYLSPRYSKQTGVYTAGPNSTVPDPNMVWPLWDTADTKTLKRNYYFGDFISGNGSRQALRDKALSGARKPNGDLYAPAMLSQEDIVNQYTDNDVSQNPEYKQGSGYPFGLNITEVIYSWSFGRYRDMIFVRHKAINRSKDTLYDCFIAPAFDPDLGVGGGAAANDYNSYFGLNPDDITRAHRVFPKTSPYYDNPTKLNMGLQWSDPEGGKQYGVIGFAFLESPVVTSNGEVVDISDSGLIGGYGPSALQQEGLTTFKKWTISNDPPTPDLRYDFLSDGSKDHDVAVKGDMRLLFSTGPFTMPPGKSVETTVAIGIAQASTTTLDLNKDSIVKLIAFAHTVFADTNGSYATTGDSTATVVKHFITPVPPDLPIISTTSLDRAVLVTWDRTAENSVDPLSPTLPFNTYELYRTTRSDHDSTIRPDGQNPIIKLGSWSVWNLKKDSIINTLKLKTSGGKDTTLMVFTGNYRYTRINKTPNELPHSFLDIGDDNNDGQINGSEGLLNGVKYYYFLLATDEFDSVNSVGPLTTAIVSPKNFAVGIPSKPVFPDLPNKIAGDSSCYSGKTSSGDPVGGITGVALDIVDTGRFVDLFLNDTIGVAFQPRWVENLNPRFLNISHLDLYINVTDTKEGLNLTYDKLYNPNASPSVTPYNTPSGILQQVIGQGKDSTFTGRFVSDNALFAPYQTVDQAFHVIVDYEFEQLKAPYRLKSITTKQGNQGDASMIRLSNRTMQPPPGVDVLANLSDIPEDATMPAFIGGLGESSYKITFGAPTTFRETDVVDTLGTLQELTSITDPGTGASVTPDHVLPIIITSTTHCDAKLKVIRPGYQNDVVVDKDARFYAVDDRGESTTPGIFLPKYKGPDTLIVPIPGKFAVDAYHYSLQDPNDPSLSSFMMKTTGQFYFPFDSRNTIGSNTLATVHRIRLGGAEIILNYPGISEKLVTGDTTTYTGHASADFNTGDEIYVSFSGLARGLPFPDTSFFIYTSKNKQIDLGASDLYKEQKILDEVQVVPNPYIVTHLGQTSTENSKLFFTRLPPRATIEIYTLSGELVTTLEHQGYTPTGDGGYSLNDRYRVQEWNLLSEGRQRVGSQVLIARIIAKDPLTGAVLGETTKKFAVILGGYRQVVGN